MIIYRLIKKFTMRNTFKLIILSFFLVSCSKTECIEKNCTEGVSISYIPVCWCKMLLIQIGKQQNATE